MGRGQISGRMRNRRMRAAWLAELRRLLLAVALGWLLGWTLVVPRTAVKDKAYETGHASATARGRRWRMVRVGLAWDALERAPRLFPEGHARPAHCPESAHQHHKVAPVACLRGLPCGQAPTSSRRSNILGARPAPPTEVWRPGSAFEHTITVLPDRRSPQCEAFPSGVVFAATSPRTQEDFVLQLIFDEPVMVPTERAHVAGCFAISPSEMKTCAQVHSCRKQR